MSLTPAPVHGSTHTRAPVGEVRVVLTHLRTALGPFADLDPERPSLDAADGDGGDLPGCRLHPDRLAAGGGEGLVGRDGEDPHCEGPDPVRVRP